MAGARSHNSPLVLFCLRFVTHITSWSQRVSDGSATVVTPTTPIYPSQCPWCGSGADARGVAVEPMPVVWQWSRYPWCGSGTDARGVAVKPMPVVWQWGRWPLCGHYLCVLLVAGDHHLCVLVVADDPSLVRVLVAGIHHDG
jgi:hypothetical protein